MHRRRRRLRRRERVQCERVLRGQRPHCAGELDAAVDAGGETCIDNGHSVQRCDFLDMLDCDNGDFANSKCMVDSDGSHWCASGTNCTIDAQCVGSVWDYCGSPGILEFSIDCSTLGLTCGLDAKSQSVGCLTDGKLNYCVGKDQPAGGTSRCDGSTLLFCDYQNESPFHCDELDGTCDDTHAEAYCRRTGDACTPFDADVNKCAGSKVKLASAARTSNSTAAHSARPARCLPPSAVIDERGSAPRPAGILGR